MIQRYDLWDWYEDDRACATAAGDGEWMAAVDVASNVARFLMPDHTNFYVRRALSQMGFTEPEVAASMAIASEDGGLGATQSKTADTGTG